MVYLTENEVAARLSCTRRAAMRVMRAAGAVQIASRKLRIAEDVLDAWMQKRSAAAMSTAALVEYASVQAARHRIRLAASLAAEKNAAPPMPCRVTYPRIKARASEAPQIQDTQPRRKRRYGAG